MTAPAPEERLWNVLRGALGTKALGIVADLGIADALADGPRPVAELARDADPHLVHRILRALASDGVFAEEAPGVFRNTATSELLRRDNPDRWREFAHLFGGPFYTAVGSVDGSAPTEPAFERAFGSDFWSWLAANAEERSAFDRAMEGGRTELADKLAALEWHDDEVVVDIGGGSGTLLRELIERRPHLRGIVFDLPETDRDEASLGDRIEFVAGNFFEHAPKGDVYILSKILHDWDDERATAILRPIRAAAPLGARVLVLDAVIPAGNEPNSAKWLDLLMHAVPGGRERMEHEWHALLDGAGFRIEQIEDGLVQARCR
jgi:hypothetical protein